MQKNCHLLPQHNVCRCLKLMKGSDRLVVDVVVAVFVAAAVDSSEDLQQTTSR